MLIGSIGCTTCVTFLCALTAEFLNTTNTAGLNAAVFFIFFYIFWWCFFIDATQYEREPSQPRPFLPSSCMLTICYARYVYLAEIWPNHLRTWGVAWGLSAFYLASEICLVGAPVALNSISWRFYLVLIIPSAVYICLIYLLFPEVSRIALILSIYLSSLCTHE